MTSRHNQKQGPISLNKKGHVDKLLRLKRKSFAQIMTQGRPAGRIGGKYPWCQSTLFSYKKRHTFFPQGRFFGVLGFLRRLARGKDYSFYFYFIIIPQGTFGGNSDDFEARQRSSKGVLIGLRGQTTKDVSVHHHVSPTLRIICHHPSRSAPESRFPSLIPRLLCI
jgi:hypothetical protein